MYFEDIKLAFERENHQGRPGRERLGAHQSRADPVRHHLVWPRAARLPVRLFEHARGDPGSSEQAGVLVFYDDSDAF